MRSWRLLLPACALIALTLVLLSSGLFSTRNASANPLGGLVAMAAGEDHTCAITDTGGVKCWGPYGLLGNGLPSRPYSRQPIPVDTADLGGSALAIAAGVRHTCVVLVSGDVKCWGKNESGQLGVSANQGLLPLLVPGLAAQATDITAGDGQSCALLVSGSIDCWGDESGSQACSVYHICTASVSVINGISDAVDVAAGTFHTCAVESSGSVKCWGRNTSGQLGDGTGTDRNQPTQVLGLTNAVQVAAGSELTCALTNNGGVMCWGLGYGNRPAAVPGLESGVKAITAAQTHACALMTSGGVKCWGNNGFGELGDGRQCGGVCPTPVDVQGIQSGATALATGLFYSCAVVAGGQAKCWGANNAGQLGNGGFANSWTPTDVAEAQVKPVPTPTPCAPVGCPTPTPRPAPPQTGLDFSISVAHAGLGGDDCGTNARQNNQCFLSPGDQIAVTVSLNALPADVNEYGGFDLYLKYAGVSTERKNDWVWPECGFPASFDGRDFEGFGCALALGVDSSSYVGPIAQSLYSCTRSGTVTLVHGKDSTGLGLLDLTTRHEASSGEQLVINCGDVPHAGDVDCSNITNATDAALMLQRGADLVDWLSCPQFADVNLDRSEDAVDSLLTLQYTAGLVAGLPILPQGP